jgi:ADP-ribosylglycohydrolase
MARGLPPLEAGRDDESSNGNGSLMRSLPVAIWFAGRPSADIVEAAHRFSALTHRHPRAQVGCALFCLIAGRLLAGIDTALAIEDGWSEAARYYGVGSFASELSAYARICSATTLRKLNAEEIRGSGYVVESLEASLWCVLNSRNFAEAVLRGVNLGDDTDTTGSITGALAGLRYGIEAIPEAWRAMLARCKDLDALFDAFVGRVASPT